MTSAFTKENTNIAKGIAVIMLLIHHLFFINQKPLFNDIVLFRWDSIEYGVFYICSAICKVCVSLFAFLSAYGVYISYEKSENVIQFYKRRFFKLYLHFWLIWLLFVPIIIIFFNKSFDVVYHRPVIINFLTNFLGIQSFFNLYGGYNGSWWFISLIILFYLLFPLFYKISKNQYVLFYTFVSSLFLYFWGYSRNLCFVYYYLPVFLFGIICAKYNLIVKIGQFLDRKYNCLLILLIILFSTTRIFLVHSTGQGYSSCVDIILSYLIVQLSYNLVTSGGGETLSAIAFWGS